MRVKIRRLGLLFKLLRGCLKHTCFIYRIICKWIVVLSRVAEEEAREEMKLAHKSQPGMDMDPGFFPPRVRSGIS